MVLPELWERQAGACAVCGYAVDLGADGRTPEGPSVDHVHALHDGGDLIPETNDGVRLVHTRCNTARGNRSRARSTRIGMRRDQPQPQPQSVALTATARKTMSMISDDEKLSASQDFSAGVVTCPTSIGPNPPDPPGYAVFAGEPVRLPRLFTDRPGDVAGSYGGAAVAWAIDALGVTARPWQAWALDRALEYRADGSLRWPVVVLSVSRQSGKSVIGKIVCGWRQDAGAAVFGEPQIVLSTANKFQTALELWQGGAYPLQARRSARVRWARGAEEIGDALGSRWVVQAATANLGVGLSISCGLVDEAWNVERDHVEASLVPTMLERESPQLWIVSTQGDSGSDLLESYRQQGVAGLADPDQADVLLLEWSADPGADVADLAAWQQASPHWSARRERFIRGQLEILADAVFRTQILNQRVDALGGWVTRSQWGACHAPDLDLAAGADAPRLVAAVEYSEDGSLYALVVTQQRGDRIVARTYGERSLDALWRRVCQLPQTALLLVSVGFKGRLPLAPCDTRMVGVTELRLATRTTLRAITDQVIAHNADPDLSRHVLTAVVAYTGETGPVLSQRRSPGPITYARALCWCVGATLEVTEQKPRPAIYSRQGE